MFNFQRIKRLPPYVFSIVDELKMKARRAGHDIVDFGMGNPDQPTPSHIVDKLLEAVEKGKNHRYSASRGITKLRDAICQWYARRYDVELDPESEAVVTIGSKEGIAHLSLSIIGLGDLVMVPAPTYPIHSYGIIIANGNVVNIPVSRDHDFFEDMERTFKTLWPRPKVLIINFPITQPPPVWTWISSSG